MADDGFRVTFTWTDETGAELASVSFTGEEWDQAYLRLWRGLDEQTRRDLLDGKIVLERVALQDLADHLKAEKRANRSQV